MSVTTSWGATPNRLRIALKFVAGSGQDGVTIDAIQQTLLPGALAGTQADDEPQGGSAIGTEVVTELRNLGLLNLKRRWFPERVAGRGRIERRSFHGASSR